METVSPVLASAVGAGGLVSLCIFLPYGSFFVFFLLLFCQLTAGKVKCVCVSPPPLLAGAFKVLV